MTLCFQAFSLYLSATAGEIPFFTFTALSLILSVMAAKAHCEVFRYRTGLPRYTARKFAWLNVTAVIVMTGLPPILMFIFSKPLYNSLSAIYVFWLGTACLNVPGIVYFVLTSTFFPKAKFKIKLPKYL